MEGEQQDKQQQDQSNLQEQKKEQFEVPKDNILATSGILDAYEYFLRSLCKNGLPSGNVFEFAALQILKYEKKLKAEQLKQSLLQRQLKKIKSKSPEQKTSLTTPSKQVKKAPTTSAKKDDKKQQDKVKEDPKKPSGKNSKQDPKNDKKDAKKEEPPKGKVTKKK